MCRRKHTNVSKMGWHADVAKARCWCRPKVDSRCFDVGSSTCILGQCPNWHELDLQHWIEHDLGLKDWKKACLDSVAKVVALAPVGNKYLKEARLTWLCMQKGMSDTLLVAWGMDKHLIIWIQVFEFKIKTNGHMYKSLLHCRETFECLIKL